MTDEQIIELADNLDCGLRCFIHRENGTIVTTPETTNIESDSELWDNSIKEIEENLDDYVEIEKMDSNDSFRIMTDFLETVDNVRLRDKLEQVLNNPRPFRNFKIEIDNSGPYRQRWFDFKRGQIVEWVKGQLTTNNL